jgi:hypothetical protein
MRCLLLAVLGACSVAPEDAHDVVGSPDDVATIPGAYAGYRVVAPCATTAFALGVSGTGSVAITDTTAISAAGQSLATELADVSSIWGWGGYGLACEPGIGTQILLDDWTQVDTVIARTGAWLAARDLALQVAIEVGPPPVAH